MTRMFQVQIELDGGFTVPPVVLERLDIEIGDEVVLEACEDHIRIRKYAIDHGAADAEMKTGEI